MEDLGLFPNEIKAEDFCLNDFKYDSLTRKVTSFYKMGCDCYKFKDHYLPYSVDIEVSNPAKIDPYAKYVIDELSYRWHLQNNKNTLGAPYSFRFRFEEEMDAILFRLRW